MIRSFIKIKHVILILFLLALGSTTLLAQANFTKDLDAYIQKAMKEWKVPGIAIGVVKDDSLIFARGYGVRELGKREKVDAHTLFAVASNTKAFTATLLGMLVDEGKLNWDDRVIDYLRDFQMYDPYVTREISIRDLLTHRSGLPTFGGDHLWIGGSFTADEIIARIRYLKPSAPFRTKFQYQNLMFLVAGRVVSKIAGESWHDVIKERIFMPLGMTESNTSVRYLVNLENVATPHEFVDGKVTPIEYDNADVLAPAGAINSNVIDMSKWMRLNLSDGVFLGEQLVSEKTMKEIHSTQMPINISPFREKVLGTHFFGYGLGWLISDYKGRKLVSHSGGLSGMISLQTLIPDEKFGVIVLSNLAPNSLTKALTYRMIDAYLGEPQRDWSAEYLKLKKQGEEKKKKAEQELISKRIKGTKPSLKLKDYTGKYVDKFSGAAEVRLEKGKLVFDYNPRHLGDLEHWHYDTFRVIWRDPIFDMSPKSFVTFYLDKTGKVEKLKVIFYDPIEFQKVRH